MPDLPTSDLTFDLTVRGRRVVRDRPLLMAIVNRTPNSFYDQGATYTDEAARAAVDLAVAEGADVVDVGGVPASPGPEVSVAEEIDRVGPTVEWIRARYPDTVISVDTYRAEVADAVARAGADLLNDNWADAEGGLVEVAARHGLGLVCAHVGGLAPRTDPVRPHYADVVADVIEDTVAQAERAVAAGVPREGVLIDPAIDFAKNTHHSLQILRRVDELVATGWPVLVAISNKGVVGESLDVGTDDRVVGTLAATALAAQAGAAMFRVHQVRASRQTLEMVACIRGVRAPAAALRYLT